MSQALAGDLPRSSGPRGVPLAATLIAVLLLLWMFRDTAATMVRIWAGSETFQHAFLVPPIVAWLIWRRRAELALLPARPMPWVLLPMAAACLLWLVGELAVVNAATHVALVSLIVLTVPALLGPAVARALAFPLGFLYFAVPFGEFMVPTLIDHTADFTVAALRLTGIPVYREGNDFIIPSGSWSVVAACSGVRYLIASVMVGTLFAYLNYRSLRRRLMFVGVAILVPVVANWLRAYMIVMIGHLSDNKLAVGVDHLLYGWVFFGIVIGLMFLIGARWAEPEAEPAAAPAVAAGGGHGSVPVPAMLAAVLALAAGAHGVLWQLDRAVDARPVTLDLGPAAVAASDLPLRPGWVQPAAAAALRAGSAEQPVWTWVGYYRKQAAYGKLVSSINLVLAPGDDRWVQTGRGRRAMAGVASLPEVRTAEFRAAQSMTGTGAERLIVWRTYWVGGRFVAGDAEAKLRLAWERVRGRGDDAAVLLWVTRQGPDAEAVLEAAVAVGLPDLAERLAATRR